MRQVKWLRLLLLVLLLGLGWPGHGLAAQPAAVGHWEAAPGTPTVLYADEESGNTYIAPPPPVAEVQAQAATIAVDYLGFPPEAQAAFQQAVTIWQGLLNAPIPIRIQASWTPLAAGVLGSAGPTELFRNPATNVWYPAALVKQLQGSDPHPGQPDITAQFNSSGIAWYFGSGQAPAGQYSFTTAVLHELTHGLGFSDDFGVSNGLGGWGQRSVSLVFDRFVVDASGISLTDTSRYDNPSPQLAVALQSGQLFFSGTNAVAANGGNKVRLFAPNPFQTGSSVSHLDERTFPTGDPNSLMTPALQAAETILSPGPIVLGVLADLGWQLTSTSVTERCFPDVPGINSCLRGRFLAYWEAHGGIPINGYPLTGERMETLEDGQQYLVQWFERVRLEYHPNNPPASQILLGQFGRRIHPTDPPAGQQPNMQYFKETGHNMAPDFFSFWSRNGGLAQFGYPISEEFVETLEDGRAYTVQYTERARFERHPENSPGNTVLLGQFGRRLLGSAATPPARPLLVPITSQSYSSLP